MFTQFVTVSTKDDYVIAIQVSSIETMQEYPTGTLITLKSGRTIESTDLIETILSRIEDDGEDEDEYDWNDEEDND